MKLLTLLICFVSFGAIGAESVQVNLGTVKMGGLLQMWALNDTTAANDAASNFRVRRAEIKFNGSVYPQTRWFVMFDPAKSLSNGAITASNDNKILQDIGAAYMIVDGLEVVIGQFKVPTTAEGLISSSELLLPERSYIGRIFGDRREPGLMIDYNPKPIRVRVMASNGQVSPGGAGTNITETNGSKDVNGRADYAINENLSIGAFGSQSHSTSGISNRHGGDVQFTDGTIEARASAVQAKELDIDKNGMSIEAGYKFMENWQAAARYENFQVTTAPSENSSSISTVGLNYFMQGHNAKIQLAYSAIHNFSGSNGTPALGTNNMPTTATNRDGGVTVLNAQMAF